MTQENKTGVEPQDFHAAWLKAANEYLESANRLWSETETDNPFLLQQKSIASQIDSMWQALSKAVSTASPGSSEPGKNVYFPEVFTKAIEPIWAGMMTIQEAGDGKKAEDLKILARQVSKGWFDIYEKEFRQILNMPQLGLTRYYQEHALEALDKYNSFQTAISQFINLLCEPMIETIQALRDEVKTAREGGEEIIKDSKDQYQEWMRKLESAYLELLKSPEYTSNLSNVMKALRDYRTSKQQLLIDLLQDLPVPTHKDMDELYKEIYTLKKRVKELEKRGKQYGR